MISKDAMADGMQRNLALAQSRPKATRSRGVPKPATGSWRSRSQRFGNADTRAHNLRKFSEMSLEDQAAAMQRILEENSDWLNLARF